MAFALAGPADLAAIVAIEARSFPFPWPPEFFLAEFGQPHSTTIVARPAVGEDHQIIGYLIFWTLFDEMHILNLAVHPSYRRRGVARQLFTEAIRRARSRGCQTAWLEVRPSNEAARQLYQSLGFQLLMTRKRYYDDTGEDALILTRQL